MKAGGHSSRRELDLARAMSSPTDYSTLAVFTYRSAILARAVPRQHMHRIAHAVIGGLFGDHTDSMFSLTVTASGAFLLADSGLAALASELPRSGDDEDTFRCLYLHESSETRRGSQIAGTLSALSARLAAEAIPVLSMTTLGRNFLLVREGATERALVTLQRTLDEPSSLPAMPPPPADRMVLTVLPAPVCICSLSRDELPAAAHALLWLFALQPAAGLTHVFEMGGEAHRPPPTKGVLLAAVCERLPPARVGVAHLRIACAARAHPGAPGVSVGAPPCGRADPRARLARTLHRRPVGRRRAGTALPRVPAALRPPNDEREHGRYEPRPRAGRPPRRRLRSPRAPL